MERQPCSLPTFQLQESSNMADNPANHLTELNAKSRADSLDQDLRVLDLYDQLLEIEQRLIPTGLHVFGRASELEQKADLLRMVASFDRPERGARALPQLIAEGLRIDHYENSLREQTANEAVELVNSIAAGAVRCFCDHGAATAADWLQQRANVDSTESLTTFQLLANVSDQLDSNHEMESLLRALRGE